MAHALCIAHCLILGAVMAFSLTKIVAISFNNGATCTWRGEKSEFNATDKEREKKESESESERTGMICYERKKKKNKIRTVATEE